jgi:hypothetical protein
MSRHNEPPSHFFFLTQGTLSPQNSAFFGTLYRVWRFCPAFSRFSPRKKGTGPLLSIKPIWLPLNLLWKGCRHQRFVNSPFAVEVRDDDYPIDVSLVHLDRQLKSDIPVIS